MEGIIHTGNQVRNMAGRKKDPLYKSFGYAFQGIFTCIRQERNMKIHVLATLIVTTLGFILGLEPLEWVACIFSIVIVIGSEMLNTAIETIVDIVSPNINPLAKKAKDIAAGAVLVLAIGALVVGLIIFIPKIVNIFFL